MISTEELVVGQKYQLVKGDIITIISKDNISGEYPFRGSNGYYYTKDGKLYSAGKSGFDIITEVGGPPFQIWVDKWYETRDGKSRVKIVDFLGTDYEFPYIGDDGRYYSETGAWTAGGGGSFRDLVVEVPEVSDEDITDKGTHNFFKRTFTYEELRNVAKALYTQDKHDDWYEDFNRVLNEKIER